MSGGIEEAARYEEQCMKKSLETGKATGRLEELQPEERGGYAPLVPRTAEILNLLPEQSIKKVLKEKDLTALSKQVGGNHYTKLKIQPLEYSMANNLNACQHTAIKYITRYPDKNGVDDLKKAIHTLEILIEFLEKGKPT